MKIVVIFKRRYLQMRGGKDDESKSEGIHENKFIFVPTFFSIMLYSFNEWRYGNTFIPEKRNAASLWGPHFLFLEKKIGEINRDLPCKFPCKSSFSNR